MWIDIDERKPPAGAEVRVAGRYIAPGTGNPLSTWTSNCVRCASGLPHFHSREWRGMVGVTNWWEEVPPATAVALTNDSTNTGTDDRSNRS